MRINVVEEGHIYELQEHDNSVSYQTVTFVKKEVDDTTNTLQLVHDGTTNEAVIEMLIDRLRHLNKIMPSQHNEVAIDRLHDVLRALELRTTDREARGVEGTNQE